MIIAFNIFAADRHSKNLQTAKKKISCLMYIFHFYLELFFITITMFSNNLKIGSAHSLITSRPFTLVATINGVIELMQ